MKLHTKIELLKFSSTVLSFIFMVLGACLLGCGLWILYDSSFISVVSSDGLQVLALALLAVGGLVLVVGVVGTVGAQRESRLLLLPVAVVLVLLVLAQAFISVLLLLNSDKISAAVTATVDKLILEYPHTQAKLLDTIQHDAECCGQTGPSDWLLNGFVQNRTQSLNQSEAEVLPCSCFVWNVSKPEPGTFCSENLTLSSNPDVLYANGSYSTGCATALQVWLTENFFTIIGMDLGLILIQVLQLVVVVSLFRSFGKKSSVKSSEPDPDQDQDLDQDHVYSDLDLLHQDRDQGVYHGPYDSPYGEPYQDSNQDYSKNRK